MRRAAWCLAALLDHIRYPTLVSQMPSATRPNALVNHGPPGGELTRQPRIYAQILGLLTWKTYPRYSGWSTSQFSELTAHRRPIDDKIVNSGEGHGGVGRFWRQDWLGGAKTRRLSPGEPGCTQLVTRCWSSKRRLGEWAAEHPTHCEPAWLASGKFHQMQDGLCLALPVQTVLGSCHSDWGTL